MTNEGTDQIGTCLLRYGTASAAAAAALVPFAPGFALEVLVGVRQIGGLVQLGRALPFVFYS